MAFGQIRDHDARYVLHDLISPISSLKLNLDLLAEYSNPKNGKIKQILNIMNFGIETLTSIINWKFEKQVVFNIRETVNEAYQLFYSECKTRKIKVRKDIKSNYCLFGYKIHFSRLLVNLFANSLEAFNMSENISKIITIKAFINSRYFILEFTDNGPGFDQGKYIAGCSSKKEGHGLGLKSCKINLRKYYKGSFGIYSVKSGTSVKVIIPSVRLRINC